MGNQDHGNEPGKNAKGKEKAPDKPDQAESGQEHSNSTLSRIAKSAAALPSASFGGGVTADEIPRVAGSEKGSSSQYGGRLNRAAQAGESSAGLRLGAASGDAIKPRQTQQHISQEEASFSAFLDSTGINQSSPLEEHHKPWQSTSTNPVRMGTTADIQSIAEQEARDGEDVVVLLSTGEELEPDFGLSESISDSDLASLRKALFAEGSGNNTLAVPWDNVLNFIPRYFDRVACSPSVQREHELSVHFGAVDTDDAWRSWVDQWSRVLTDYQDEVWGDLEPLVLQARDDVKRLEEVQPGDKLPRPTALLRLRAILGHLRGPGLS